MTKMQETSLQAHIKLAPHLNKLETAMHTFFQQHPHHRFTDLQLQFSLNQENTLKGASYQWKLSCVNGRRNSLVKKGLVESAGRMRNLETGVSNIMWRLKR